MCQNYEDLQIVKQTAESQQLRQKENTSYADEFYGKFLQAQVDIEKKDRLLEQSEQEYNKVRDAQEAYRDQIDQLEDQIDQLKA